MSHVIEVKKNPDGSWTAMGATSLLVVSVTSTAKHKAISNLSIALDAIRQKVKP